MPRNESKLEKCARKERRKGFVPAYFLRLLRKQGGVEERQKFQQLCQSVQVNKFKYIQVMHTLYTHGGQGFVALVLSHYQSAPLLWQTAAYPEVPVMDLN